MAPLQTRTCRRIRVAARTAGSNRILWGRKVDASILMRMPQSLRVLAVLGQVLGPRGGVQAETAMLLGALRERGVSVGLVLDANSPKDIRGVQYFPLEHPPRSRAVAQISAAIAGFRPHVLHAIGGGLRTYLYTQRAAGALPWVATIHNLPPTEAPSAYFACRDRAYYPLRWLRQFPVSMSWRVALRRATFAKVVCHSEQVARAIVRRGGDRSRITVIPLGIDPHEGTDTCVPIIPPGRPKVVTVASFVHHKGLHDFAQALRELTAASLDLEWIVIGGRRDGIYLAALQRRIQHWGLADRVVLKPDAPDQEKLRLLASASLYVQPSHEEGFCLAFLEAVQVVPRVLGTKTGAIEEMASGCTGVSVVPPRRPDLLAQEVRRLLSEPIPESLLATRRAALDARFGWSGYVDRHLELFEHAASQSAS